MSLDSLLKNLHFTIDIVSDLPYEIYEIIFLDLSPKTLLNCSRVSKSWKQMAENDNIWKSKFQDEKSWENYSNDNSPPDSWYELFKERYLLESSLLEQNWKNDKFTEYILDGDDVDTCCVKFFQDWIITGSEDCTIKIWDNKTYKCLRVLGKPNPEHSESYLSESEFQELTTEMVDMTHLRDVIALDINDKYLVSCSLDGSFIIWDVPNFDPIECLFIYPEGGVDSRVALYNDYIAFCGRNIEVWKLSLDNWGYELNLQHRIKENWADQFCIHNGIIYGMFLGEYGGIISCNIETGQSMGYFPFYGVNCLAVNDQYLFVSDDHKIKALNLQTHETIILSGSYADSLCIHNNKLISTQLQYDLISIWNLNDLQLFKAFKDLDNLNESIYMSSSPIEADSKRLAFLTNSGDVSIYDFSQGKNT